VPSKFKHHFETKHTNTKASLLSFFPKEICSKNLSIVTTYMHTKFKSENEYEFMASTNISHHITGEGEAHITVGRTH
jgi:hypothetical protein